MCWSMEGCAAPRSGGCENLTKRHLVAALSFNLSLLLRTIFVTGTAKQWLAGPPEIMMRWIDVIDRLLEASMRNLGILLRGSIPVVDSVAQRQNWQLQLAS